MRRRSFLVLHFAFLILSGCSDPLNSPHALSPLPDYAPTAQISYLYELYNDAPVRINEPVSFSGYVTANDRSGNFYKTIIIQDDVAALEIKAGLYDLYNIFPIGQKVIVEAQGAWVGKYNGVMQLGRVAYEHSAWRVEEFGVRSLLDKYVFRGDGNQTIEPTKRKIATIRDNDCGLLIETEKVLLKSEFNTIWEGLHTFYNSAGDSIAVYTSPYADFARQPIPSDSIALIGILTKGRYDDSAEQYAIKL